MSEVIKGLFADKEPVAACECGDTLFFLRTDGFGDNWERIIGTECAGCGDIINWVRVEREEKQKS